MDNRKLKVFRILRFFSVTSLISIVIAALLLTWLYRQVSIGGIIASGEHSNLMLSQSLLNAVQPELSAYLADEMLHHSQPLPDFMQQEIRRLMADTSVEQVTIIDDEGIIVFSTEQSRMGSPLPDNASFSLANTGEVVSRLDQEHGITPFMPANGRASRINSYIPIRAPQQRTIEGVFAVETDVRPLMAEIEQTKFQVFFASIGIMLLLYLVLLGIVRHAERIIGRQNTMLRERSQALEMLSAQLITVQEREKKRLAEELHEGVAQTLSSVKFRLEHARGLLKERVAGSESSLEQLVPLVQEAIREVRTLAMTIRPPSLDEIGAIGTMKWYCSELTAAYPQLELVREISLQEAEIPQPLKVVLYRSLQQLLPPLAEAEETVQATVRLGKSAEAIWLEVIDDLPRERPDGGMQQATMREFIALSGGELSVSAPNARGGATVHIAWPL